MNAISWLFIQILTRYRLHCSSQHVVTMVTDESPLHPGNRSPCLWTLRWTLSYGCPRGGWRVCTCLFSLWQDWGHEKQNVGFITHNYKYTNSWATWTFKLEQTWRHTLTYLFNLLTDNCFNIKHIGRSLGQIIISSSAMSCCKHIFRCHLMPLCKVADTTL